LGENRATQTAAAAACQQGNGNNKNNVRHNQWRNFRSFCFVFVKKMFT
jgi:hypothetical protein